MKDQAQQESQGHQHSNLMDAPMQATAVGTSASPPPLQLQASSLADLVSPVAAMAQSPVQLTGLGDYNDKKPEHDPSQLSDAVIQATDEYKDLLNKHHLVPTTDPSILYTPAEILLACRLLLRSMREG